MSFTPPVISSRIQFQELAMTECDTTIVDEAGKKKEKNESEMDGIKTIGSGVDSDSSRPHGKSLLGKWIETSDGTIKTLDLSHSHRANNLEHCQPGICWLNAPDEPWSWSFYLSERGLDNIHIYFWITKDLCWVQSWFFAGIAIGSTACLYALLLAFRAIYWQRNISLFWIKIAEFLWLFANFWWMIGELHDDHYGYTDNDDNSIVDKYTHEGGCMLIATMVWVSLYYIILKPLKLLDEEDNHDVDATSSLKPRFSFFFKTWNEYENVHIFFWAGKDTAWNWWIQSMWIVFFVPTFIIGIDFVYITLRTKRLVIDHAHYFAQFMWVLANAVWAGGEFLITPNHDDPVPLGRFSSEARHTSRWYSSWVVIGSYIPLVALYVMWFYHTYFGQAYLAKTRKPQSDPTDRKSEESFDSKPSSANSVDGVINPIIPVRAVSVQSHPSLTSNGEALSWNSKSTFKVSTLKDAEHIDEENTGELRMSDLSRSNSVINGADL